MNDGGAFPENVELRRLRTRGFETLTERDAAAVAPWLRFTPLLQALLFALCTATGSAAALVGMAIMLALAALTGHHLFDGLYHAVIRPLEKTPVLPRCPPRRRIVFLIGSLWCLATAHEFAAGRVATGTLLGSLMTASTALVAFTHICIPSMAIRAVRDGIRTVRGTGGGPRT